MAMITNIQLVDCFRQCLAERWGYVFGARGVLYSEKEAVKRRDGGYSVPSGRSKSTYFTKDCAKWYGRMVADCSGGITYAVQQYDPTFKALTANGYKAAFTESGPISTIPEIPGLAVWNEGHIGVYVGNGKVIEFRGTDYGCVETSLKDRKNFTTWGKLGCVEYPGQVQDESGDDTPAEPVDPGPFYAVCTGGSVNVRTGPGTHYEAITIVHKDDKLIAVRQSNGWYEVCWFDAKGWHSGFMSGLYVQEI